MTTLGKVHGESKYTLNPVPKYLSDTLRITRINNVHFDVHSIS